MAHETDGIHGAPTPKVLDQGQRIERALIGADGTITIPKSEAVLKSVDVADVDLLLTFSDESMVVIPNGALDAISEKPNPVLFNDGKASLEHLFKMVGVSTPAKAGSLRVVSGNVDAPKTPEEPEPPSRSQGSESTPEGEAPLPELPAPAPMAKISRLLPTSSGAGGQMAESTDPVIQKTDPTMPVYREGQNNAAPPLPTITINPITADNIVNIAESQGTVAVSGYVGGAKAGSTITLSINGVSYTGEVAADMSFSIDVAGSDLAADFDHTVSAKVSSTVGSGSADKGYGTDFRVPAAPVVALAVDSGLSHSDNITNDGTLQISGTEAGARLEYSNDGGRTWGSTFTAVEGANTVEVRQTNGVGNSSGTGTLTFTLDTTPPAAPTLGLAQDSTDGAAGHDSDRITNSAVLSVSAATEPVTREYSVDGGAWNTTYNAPTVDGIHTVSIRDTDVAGNASSASTLTFILDTTVAAPTISLAVDSTDGGAGHGSDLITNTAAITVSSPTEFVTREYRVDGGAWSTSYAAPTTDGSHTVVVRDTDVAGNTATGSLTFTLDSVAPATPGVSLAVDSSDGGAGHAGDHITNSAAIVVTPSSEPVTREYSVDGGAWSTGYTAPTVDGNHTVSVRDIDVAGNVSNTGSLAFTLDTAVAAPTVALSVDSTDGVAGHGSDLITNNAAITVSPTAEPVTREYSVDGGAWSTTYTAPTVDGSHTVGVRDTDVAGNTASGTLTFTLDTTVATPAVSLAADSGSSNSDKITNNGNLLLGGIEANATVAYSTDGGTTWNAAFTAVEGTNTVLVRQIDVAGNVSGTGSLTFTLDTVPPVPTITPDPAITADNVISFAEMGGPVAVTGTVGGDAHAGDTVTLTVNGNSYTGFVQAGNTYSISVSGTDLVFDADHTVDASVTTVDVAGNSGTATGSTSYSVGFTVLVPTITLDPAITADNIIGIAEAGGSVAITGSVGGDAKAGDTVTLTVNGTTYTGLVQTGNTFSINVAGSDLVADPDHTVDASVTTSGVGIPGTATDTQVYGVNVIPVITGAVDDRSPVTGNTANGGVTNDTTPTLTGIALHNGTVDIYDNGIKVGTVTADGSGQWSYTAPALSDGSTHDFTAVAVDAAGNPINATDAAGNITGTASAPYSLHIDATAPSAPIVTGAVDHVVPGLGIVGDGGYTNDTRPTLTGTAEAGSTVTISDGGTQVGVVTADGSGNWSYTTGILADGSTHTYTVTATDAAGNVSAASVYGLHVDTTAPAAPTIALAVDSSDGGFGHDADRVTNNAGLLFSAPSETVTREYSVDGGAWSGTYSAPTADGSHTVVVRDTDLAGNASSGSLTFTLDTTAPAAPVIIGAADNANPVQGNVANGGTTNDATPTLSGVAEVNSVVTIYDGGTLLGTTTANSSGLWSYTTGLLADGTSHDFTVTATDAAGNVSAASANYTVHIDTTPPGTPTISGATDDVPPVLGNIANGGYTNDTTPTLSGVAEANSTVTITDGGTQVGTAIADGSGNWSFTPTPLSEGTTHNYTVTATDAAGNVSGSSATYTVHVVTTVPPPAITGAIDDVNPVTGSVASGGYTNDTQPTLTGTAQANSTVSIYNGAVLVGTATADGSGTWSFTPVTAIADGRYDFSATATDVAGNTSASSSMYTLHIDTSAPTPAITGVTDAVNPLTGNVANGGYTNDTAPMLTGIAEANSTVKVYDGVGNLIGTVSANQSGSWSYTPGAPLADGNHDFTVTATDAAGNVSANSTVYTVHVDTAAPGVPVVSLTTDSSDGGGGHGSDLITNSAAITVSAPTESGVREYSVDGGGWSTTYTAPTVNGSHTVSVRDTDLAGNTGSTGSLTFTLDTTVATPTVGLAVDSTNGRLGLGYTTDGVTNDATLNVSAPAESVTREYRVDGGGWSTTYTAPTADGSHTVTVRDTDVAGNTATGSVSFTLDKSSTAPTFYQVSDNVGPVTGGIANGGSTNDTTPSFQNGYSEPGSLISISGGPAPVTVYADALTGSWVYNPTLTEGTYTFSFVATDPAGNTSAPTTFTLTVDTSAPSAPTISKAVDDVSPVTADVAHGGYTNDTKPTLSGTAEANSTIKISISDGTSTNPGVPGSVTADASGNWSWTPTVALSNGITYDFTVTATDRAGNVSGSSSPFTLHIDTTIATPTISTVTTDAPVVGSVANGGYTNDTTPTLSGTAEANSTVTIYDGVALVGTTTANGSGSWSFTPGGLADGSAHDYTVKATDLAGNVSVSSSTYTLHIDTTAPGVPTIAAVTDNVNPVTGNVGNGGYTNDTTPTLTGTAEANSTVTIYDGVALVGTTTADGSGNWSYTTGALADGSNYSFTVTATDAAGNASGNSAAHVIHVDTTVPVAPTITFGVDAAGNSDGTFVLSGIEAGATVEYSLDGSTWSGTTPTIDTSAGEHHYYVHQIDQAGNISNVTDFSVIYGSDVSGNLFTNPPANALFGLGGDDLMTGSAANDMLYGDTGNDTLNGGAGNDIMYGGSGDDTIWANAGMDSAYGGDGNDTFYVSTKAANAPAVIDGGARNVVVGDGNVVVLQDLGSAYSVSTIAPVLHNVDTLNIKEGIATTLTITAQDIQNMVGNGAASQLQIKADNGDTISIATGGGITYTTTVVDATHTDYTIYNSGVQAAQIHWNHS